MILDLEHLALVRSDEQLAAGAWKRRDPDEPGKLSGFSCAVCSETFARHGNARICDPCRAAGWTPAKCDCGAPLHRRDQTSRGRLRGFCGTCRAAMRTRPGVAAPEERRSA